MSVYKEGWYAVEELRKQMGPSRKIAVRKDSQTWREVKTLAGYSVDGTRNEGYHGDRKWATLRVRLNTETDDPQWMDFILVYEGKDGWGWVSLGAADGPPPRPQVTIPWYEVPCMACGREGYTECWDGECQR